jgi:hypothetical protein
MKFYTLKHIKTGELAGWYAESNDGHQFAGAVSYTIEPGKSWTKSLWAVTSREIAEAAAATNTEWYNAEYTTPINEYVGEWEVVEFEI